MTQLSKLIESSSPVVALLSNGFTTNWCIVWQGKAYPFGPDDFAKELAEWAAPRLEAGKESYGADPRYQILR
jgi:hypothetical protein